MATPIRIVHTADVHLDLCFAGSGMPASFGNRRRQSLRDVFQAIVRRAGEWPADALLIAGDLIEGERVTRDTIQFLRGEFASIPHVPIVIAPGNHDPYTPTSPYATEAWPENVTIFRTPEWSEVTLAEGRLVVHGFAFDGPEISHNPFGELSIPKDKAVHVAVGHGSERGHQPEDKAQYAPFDAAAAADGRLAYLALGHFHSDTPIEGDFKTVVRYSGAPEGHGFRETGEHCILEVSIGGGAVEVTPAVTSRAVYSTETIPCEGFGSSQDVVQALRKLASEVDRRLIARVTLSGNVAVDLSSEIESIYDAVAPDFEFLDLIDQTASVEDYEALAREDTSLGLFVQSLNEEIADHPDDARRDMLLRARGLGVAAFRQRRVALRGMERGDS